MSSPQVPDVDSEATPVTRPLPARSAPDLPASGSAPVAPVSPPAPASASVSASAPAQTSARTSARTQTSARTRASASAASPVRQSLREAVRAVRDRRNRKVVVGCGLATAFLVAFGGYATVEGPPPRSEAVVYFDPAATVEQKDAVRAACPTVGNAVQLPPDSGNLAISRVYPLRYDVSRASSQDRADLYRCVQAQPGVKGISTTTQGQ